jgi:hypothetical protein
MYSLLELSACLLLSSLQLTATATHQGCRFRLFLPPLAPFLALCTATLEGRHSDAAGDYFPTSWGKDTPNHLHVGGVLGSDVTLIVYLTMLFGA